MDADLEFCLGKFFNDQKNIVRSNVERADQVLDACNQASLVDRGMYMLNSEPSRHLAARWLDFADALGYDYYRISVSFMRFYIN